MNKKKVKTDVRKLPSGFWAVFIDGSFVDAASTSREEALAILGKFLRKEPNIKRRG